MKILYKHDPRSLAMNGLSVALLTMIAFSAGGKDAIQAQTKPSAPIKNLQIQPTEATLDGSYSFQTLVAVGKSSDGGERDLSEVASYSSSNPSVVRMDSKGVAYPVNDGTAIVTVSVNGHSAKAKLTVRNTKTNNRLYYETAIAPILIKGGCVGSGCHGAPNGQAGFKLSFFGYETEKDWNAIVKGNNGRRVNFNDPTKSSFLMKPAGIVWHGGGKRFRPDGPESRVFTAWIKAGAPFLPGKSAKADRGTRLAGLAPASAMPKLESVRVCPIPVLFANRTPATRSWSWRSIATLRSRCNTLCTLLL